MNNSKMTYTDVTLFTLRFQDGSLYDELFSPLSVLCNLFLQWSDGERP